MKNKLTADQNRTIESALNILRENAPKYDISLTSSTATEAFCSLRLAACENEQFLVLFLNSQHQVIADEILFTGTIDSASVYPREVVKAALRHNAAALILAHNHPSGIPEPSQADIRLTKRVKDAAELLDISVLDHVIIAGSSSHSFAEHGQM